ncbi:MAG: DUF938 domain-containing protein [Oscillatoriales cyanobacterium RM1_1_9]|nr:DUF938 domain-containing protein [Oscillatoriales cyanobacterium RM2_1_1]NJO72087.1 DUF938 domain-containing protein [Oscillatoriales cyanobacterium RM1_1_9]
MDERQFSPATDRNRQPILEVLQRVLPPDGMILEIASGTGQHSVFFAPHFPAQIWLPSDLNPRNLSSILAWQSREPADNLLPPITLNASASTWPVETTEFQIAAIVNINMIHISPWSVCLGLLAGANRVLPSGGVLYLYGPFKQGGQHTALSNAAFDQSLQLQNPTWGVRDLDEVIAVAQTKQLKLIEVAPMPANNLSVIFHKI